MRGPKVIQYEIDRLNKDLSITERLHFMVNKLLRVSAQESYRQISECRQRYWERKQKLLREKKRAIRLRR